MTKFASLDSLAELYEDHIIPHADAPRHRGRIPHATHSACLRNPRCGDEVLLDLLIDGDGHIIGARFEARGCLISQAAADILCEFVEAKTVCGIQQLTAHEMLDLLGVPLTPRRIDCALLVFSALKVIIDHLDASAGSARADSHLPILNGARHVTQPPAALRSPTVET